MTRDQNIRDTVIRSLSAVGAEKDAKFYAELFAAQDPEKFALIVVDPRCVKNPLLESLIGNIRILSDLGLTPTLLIGALDDDLSNIRFSSQRLSKELENARVRPVRLNTESYGLTDSVRTAARQGKISILENITPNKQKTLEKLVKNLSPAKVIFLQPSGGIAQNGQRLAVINADDKLMKNLSDLTAGQRRFIKMAKSLLSSGPEKTVYVIASPLNLLRELFTVKGSGTMIRRGAKIKSFKSLRGVSVQKLVESLEAGFGKPLKIDPRFWNIEKIILDSDYRAGAIITELNQIPYLNKFWVVKEAQGEGLARDVWAALTKRNKKIFWRSRKENPFNDWYLKSCDGMQLSGPWRVFWIGLEPEDIESAVNSAINAPVDF